MTPNDTNALPPAGDDRPPVGQEDGVGSPLAGDVLDEFFVGALDAPRAASVRRYVDRTTASRALFVRLQAWLSRDDVMRQLPTAEASAAELRAKIEAAHVGERPAAIAAAVRGAAVVGMPRAFTSRTSVAGRVWRPWAFATAAAAVVGGAVLVMHPFTRPGAGAAEHVYATATGQRAVLTLDDGTRVTLAPRTMLRVARTGARSRAIALDGEAFFEVTRAAGAPFVVRAGGVSARVLGTAFLVSHYDADAGVRVAVSSGKVAVTAGAPHGPGVTVTAGRVAEVTDSGIATRPADDGQYTGWLSGRLVFHNTPAAEVLATLSRWYGYEFRLADAALAQRRLTAGLSTQSSTAAFSTIKLLLDVDLTFDGDVVTLTPRAARPPARLDRRETRDTLTPYLQHEVGR